MSPVSTLANTQHGWVCGIQPVQPPRLQQLQAGREPEHQQPGNGMSIHREGRRRWRKDELVLEGLEAPPIKVASRVKALSTWNVLAGGQPSRTGHGPLNTSR